MMGMKECTKLATIGSCSEYKVAIYARYIYAIGLQKSSKLLELARKFSIALEMSNHMSTSYLDIRIRLHLRKMVIINLNPLVLPIFKRHTGLLMFEIVSKASGTLCTACKDNNIETSINGE